MFSSILNDSKRHFGRNKRHFIAFFTWLGESDLETRHYRLYICIIISNERKAIIKQYEVKQTMNNIAKSFSFNATY
jgi:hypothetical protein